jgi:hypothetical protein
MSKPTMNDVLNQTPEAKAELHRKINRQIATFIAIKVVVTVGTVVAAKAIVRQIEKAEQIANK